MKSKKLEQATKEILDRINAGATDDEVYALLTTKAEAIASSLLPIARMEQALKELPTCQAKILELVYGDGMRLEEVANRLRMPVEDVRHALVSAVARLAVDGREEI